MIVENHFTSRTTQSFALTLQKPSRCRRNRCSYRFSALVRRDGLRRPDKSIVTWLPGLRVTVDGGDATAPVWSIEICRSLDHTWPTFIEKMMKDKSGWCFPLFAKKGKCHCRSDNWQMVDGKKWVNQKLGKGKG